MSQDQQQYPTDESESGRSGGSAQQQQQPQPQEGHAGQGSESIINELREWERRRNQGGRRRTGPSN